MPNNLILLATYWNESEWVDRSLSQIELLDPKEIVICDGCFDPTIPNFSTDGTREKLEYFVKHNKNRARLISSIRTPRALNAFKMIKGLDLAKNKRVMPARLYTAFKTSIRMSPYRINQALTFSYMARLCKTWAPNSWVMTYDADQFYSDSLIDSFGLVNEVSDYGLITAREHTFPNNFLESTDEFEKRIWNNLPHKIFDSTSIYPTRHIVLESQFRHEMYHEVVPCFDGGYYCHYKFRADTERLEKGYSLGDRKEPSKKRFSNLGEFELEHPKTIRSGFKF